MWRLAALNLVDLAVVVVAAAAAASFGRYILVPVLRSCVCVPLTPPSRPHPLATQQLTPPPPPRIIHPLFSGFVVCCCGCGCGSSCAATPGLQSETLFIKNCKRTVKLHKNMPPIAFTASDGAGGSLLETHLGTEATDQPPSSGCPLPKYYEDEDIIGIVNEIVEKEVEEEEPKYARVDLTRISNRRRRENR